MIHPVPPPVDSAERLIAQAATLADHLRTGDDHAAYQQTISLRALCDVVARDLVRRLINMATICRGAMRD